MGVHEVHRAQPEAQLLSQSGRHSLHRVVVRVELDLTNMVEGLLMIKKECEKYYLAGTINQQVLVFF